MTDLDPLLGRAFPAPSGPPQPPLVLATRAAVDPTTAPSARASTRPTRPRRRHPATGGRIIAAGLGATTMFGIIAAMGMAQAASSSATSTPALDASITLAPLPTITPDPTIAPVVGPSDPSTASVPSSTATPTIPAPIVLEARPDVHVVTPAAPAAPAPIATTSGSG